MAITVNPAIAVSTYSVTDGSPAVTSELALLAVGNITYKGRWLINVLEELFCKVEGKAYAPVSARNANKWQKFTSDGTFVVPEGITRVLVLCISAGMSTSGTRRGGVLVSRYVDVTPGESIPVEVGQPTSPTTGYINASMALTMTSSFGDRTLRATFSGSNYAHQYIVVDDTEYIANTPETNLTEALKEKGVVTLGAAARSASPTSRSRGTAGTGGFNVEQVGTLVERSNWLSVARDMPPIALPVSRKCYPDTTQLAGTTTGTYAGKGANYGGGAGCWAMGHAYVGSGSKGGQGLVCVFWGDDIETKFTTKDRRRTNIGKVEPDGSITPLVNTLDARDIPYGEGTLEDAVSGLVNKYKQV